MTMYVSPAAAKTYREHPARYGDQDPLVFTIDVSVQRAQGEVPQAVGWLVAFDHRLQNRHELQCLVWLPDLL